MPLHLKGEDLIQAVVMAELRKAGVLAFHPPNEGRHTKAYRAKQIRMGMLPGVSDVIILQPTEQGRPGAVLELKKQGEKPRPNQLAFLEAARAQGYAASWADSIDEALTTLRFWGYLPEQEET